MRNGVHLTKPELDTLRQGLVDTRRQLDHLATPVIDADIADLLIAFAELTGCTEPGEAGIKLYMQTLNTIPRPALRAARQGLASTHRYKRLPLPAEILTACQPHIDDITKSRTWLNTYIDAVDRRLDQLHRQGTIL